MQFSRHLTAEGHGGTQAHLICKAHSENPTSTDADLCHYSTKFFNSSALREPPWYGAVCPVVWEVGGREPSSYPMTVDNSLQSGFLCVPSLPWFENNHKTTNINFSLDFEWSSFYFKLHNQFYS
jgi:hypothetical protein